MWTCFFEIFRVAEILNPLIKPTKRDETTNFSASYRLYRLPYNIQQNTWNQFHPVTKYFNRKPYLFLMKSLIWTLTNWKRTKLSDFVDAIDYPKTRIRRYLLKPNDNLQQVKQSPQLNFPFKYLSRNCKILILYIKGQWSFPAKSGQSLALEENQELQYRRHRWSNTLILNAKSLYCELWEI